MAHIITYGATGVGKSWLANNLAATPEFKEGDALESVTTTIQTAVSWNGSDLVCDVPGYLDSGGRDAIQQANFIDFLPKKIIRAIVFVFTGRADAFTQAALNAFKDSDLKNNVILVLNKDLSTRPADIGNFQGFPLVYIKAHQTNVDVLKRLISAMKPVYVNYPPTPVTLFKTPLKILKEEIVTELEGFEMMKDPETIISVKALPYQRQVWADDWGNITGRKKTIQDVKMVTESTQVMVDRKYNILHTYKLTFAERFDGVAGLYKKEFVEAQKQRV